MICTGFIANTARVYNIYTINSMTIQLAIKSK